jgi:DnaJ-class molecular chaperone
MTIRLDELDYYALFGLTQGATVDAVKAGFRAFARRYHPDRFAGDAAQVAEATRIYLRATEAYRVLTQPEQRRIYDACLQQGQLRMEPLGAVGNPRSQRPSQKSTRPDGVLARARPFVARAEQALLAGDLKQARLNYQIALQHDPENSKLRHKLTEVEGRLSAGS